MHCSAGCAEIARPFEIQYEFGLVTIREDCEVGLRCSIAGVTIVVFYRRRLETCPFRRLLICTTKWPGVGQSSSLRMKCGTMVADFVHELISQTV
jgi:hypothetical protein